MPEDSGRLPLGDGGWELWREFVLRSAGFPFAALTKAVSDETTADDDALAEFDWAGSVAESMQRALRLAGSDELRMALLWQNPQIVGLSVDWLKNSSTEAPKRTSRRRASEHTVMKYLQRYHCKNESVGFFGPVVWGAFGAHDGRIAVVPGPAVRGRQRVYFEDWAIEAVGRAFSVEPEIAEQLPPALAFGVGRLGRTLAGPDGRLVRLSAEQAQVIALIDGRRTGRDIAAELCVSADAVDGVLAPLIDAGLLTRVFEVPPELDVEQTLARALSELNGAPAVSRSLAALADLEAARAAVEDTATADALSTALAELDDRFAAITGTAATRRRDESQAGRRLLSTQSERGVRITLGSCLAGDLAAPLNLVLRSARWLTRRAGEEFQVIAAKVHQDMAPLYSDDAVPLNALISRLVLITQPGEWLDGLIADLERRWLSVLEPDFEASRIVRSAASLAEAVDREFSGPAPGYSAGRHQSPDIMIAAASTAAIEAGDFEAVLGELHVGMVTVDSRTFTDFAEDPDKVRRCSELALVDGQPRFVPLHARGTDATISGWDYPAPDGFSPRYTYLSFGERVGERSVPGTKFSADAITVRESGGQLSASFPDSTCHPLLQVLGEYVVYALVSRFRTLPPRPHTPRVTVDRLVVTRETWRIPGAQLEPLTKLAEPAAFVELRRLATAYGLPRHLYWRSERAAKPIYLDLQSPLLAAVLVREVRRAAGGVDTITFSEMYPGPEDLWLPDAEGRRYTSELRLTVADTTLPEGADR